MATGPAIQELIPNNQCWGCSPTNPDGLQIKSRWDGDEVVCVWQPGPPYFAGPTHVVNGGIIATIIDCHAICTAIADAYRREERAIGSTPEIWCATGKLEISYLRPVPIDALVTLRAHVTERAGRRTTVACSLHAGNEERARAEAVAVRVREEWRHGTSREAR